MSSTSPQRTFVVTGAAGGIGAATCDLLRSQGHRAIGVDLKEAEGVDVLADLGTPAGRDALVDSIRAAAPDGIDGIVANAGVLRPGGPAVRVNHFGAIATLEGLRPLLRPAADGGAPRAVLVASRAVLLEVDDEVVDACLAGNEEAAAERASTLDGGVAYASSKRAVARWMRRVAPTAEWAGAGIPLNAVGPGAVATPMIAHRSAEEQAKLLEGRPMPLGGIAEAAEVAEVITWFLAEGNTKVTGQLVFVDGGGETLMRGDDIWP